MWNRFVSNNSGNALIEFAIVSVLLVLLFAGVVDYSNALYERGVLVEASWAGVRASELNVIPWSTKTDADEKAAEDYNNLVQRYREGLEVARTFIANNGLSVDDYHYKMVSLLDEDAATGVVSAAIRLIISDRRDAPRFFILPHRAFQNCVGSSMAMERGVRNLVFDGLMVSVNGVDENCNP